jgi:hypothetical protein
MELDEVTRLLDLTTHPSLRMHEAESEFFVLTDEFFFCRHKNTPLL